MKAEELRIGNCVNIHGYESEITSRDIVNIEENENDGWYGKPIPLSEDWLKRFGFINSYGNHFSFQVGGDYEKGTKIISVNTESKTFQISVGTGGDNMNYIFLDYPEYVHTL